MKIPLKFPLTDKFLLDLYCSFEKLENALEPLEMFTIKSWNDICYPESSQFWREYEKKRNKKQFRQFIDYLKRKGYIKIKNLEEGKGILLTSKGMQKAFRIKYKINSRDLKLKKRKDKKWIMVIFDIPEKMRKSRDDLRNFLYTLGFQNLQKSVWVSPYDVYKDLENMIRIHSIDKFVRIFLIEEIEI